MKKAFGKQFLHTPGPTPLPERVLNAMHRQPLDFSDPEFIGLLEACFEGLKPIFRTEGSIFIYAANGHGGWEAALTNLFDVSERVLMPTTGHFSDSWADHAKALGLDVVVLAGPGRRAIDPAAVEQELRRDTAHEIAAVLVVQTDTAAGVTSDVAAIRKAMDRARHPALLVVDTIASLGATPFSMDDWGVDVTIAASQKALMGPPGLALIAANDRALAKARQVSRPRRYWDWSYRMAPESYRRFCGTAPEYNLFALAEGLALIREEGLETMIERHALIAGAVHAAVGVWASAGGVAFHATEPSERASAVTTILTPGGFDSQILRDYVRQRLGIALAGGLGPLTGKAFRIGHLGETNIPTILGCLGGVELGLRHFGIALGSGGVEAAIAFLDERLAEPIAEPVQPMKARA